MQTVYENITTRDGFKVTTFNVSTKKGWIHGLFMPEENKIFVHGVTAQNGLKGLMRVLINKFKTNKIQFTPLITDMLEKKIKGGVVSMIPASDKSNPYGEDIQVLDCNWVV